MSKEARERAEAVFSADDYLKEVLALIPEDKRETSLERIGGHILRQDEFSRLSDEARTAREKAEAHKARLDDWYAENLGSIDKGLELARKLEPLREAGVLPENFDDLDVDEITEALGKPAANANQVAPAAPVKPGMTEAQVQALLQNQAQELEMKGLNTMAFMSTTAVEHYKTYGKSLNLAELLQHSAKTRLPLDQAYLDLTKDARTKLAEQQEADKEKALEAKLREKIMREQANGHPYPIGESGSISDTLGGLSKKKDEKPQYGVQAALDEYYRTLATQQRT